MKKLLIYSWLYKKALKIQHFVIKNRNLEFSNVIQMLWCNSCLRKKYGVADYQYFKNGNSNGLFSDIINTTFI